MDDRSEGSRFAPGWWLIPAVAGGLMGWAALAALVRAILNIWYA